MTARYRKYRRIPSPDMMEQMIGDGAFEDDPVDERPGWYVRGRKSKASEAARQAVERSRQQREKS